ncbi:hypothetical protein DF186_17340, partial [Enterococcus hirae]
AHVPVVVVRGHLVRLDHPEDATGVASHDVVLGEGHGADGAVLVTHLAVLLQDRRDVLGEGQVGHLAALLTLKGALLSRAEHHEHRENS